MSVTITVYERIPENTKLDQTDYIRLKRNKTIVNPFYKDEDSRYVVYTI